MADEKPDEKAEEKAEEKADEEVEPIPGLGTREGDKLREALHAFEAGDYVTVRARTTGLADAEDEAVRKAAAHLATRIAVDPIQVVVISACAAVMCAIVYIWVI